MALTGCKASNASNCKVFSGAKVNECLQTGRNEDCGAEDRRLVLAVSRQPGTQDKCIRADLNISL